MAELSNLDKKMMASDIKESYQQVQNGWKSAIEKSIEFGGKLDYCKSQIEHGKWLKFLEYCGVPERTASGMMRMYKHRELLREKSAENWDEAARIMQAETNPNRQRIADLTVVGVVSNPVPKLEAAVPTILQGPSNQVVIEQPKSVPESIDANEEKQRRSNSQRWNKSLEYASGLDRYNKIMFVSRLLASIETDSWEFQHLPHEIWTSFLNRYEDIDTTREKTKQFSELFLDDPIDPIDTSDHSTVAKYLVDLKEDDEAMVSFLGALLGAAGSSGAAVELLKIMQVAFIIAASQRKSSDQVAAQPSQK